MWRLVSGLFVVPCLLVIAARLQGVKPDAWSLLNFAVYPFIVLTNTVVHELGHAAMANAVGVKVLRVNVGIGKRIARWAWGTTPIVIHAIPDGGGTFIGIDGEAGWRWKTWLVVAAGPATTFVALFVAMDLGSLTLREAILPATTFARGVAIWEMFAFTNLISLVMNLLPLKSGLSMTDGMQLLKIPSRSSDVAQELMITPVIHEAEDLRERDEHEAARALLEPLALRFPSSWFVINSLALNQLERRQYTEARSSFCALLQGTPPDPTTAWVIRNNLAWTDFLLRLDEHKAEADEHSAAVVAKFPYTGFALGTRGLVLVWLGRPGDAVEVLEQAYLRNSSPSNRALNASGMAIALAALGRSKEAARWLIRARENHPNCVLMAEAEGAVALSQAADERAHEATIARGET